LKQHLFTLPEHPDWIPYKTSYYKENWGFCLTHNHFLSLEDGKYEVVIDSTLEDGFMTYGEVYIPGKLDDEILISTHICHPSLANDNLSGVCTSTILAKYLAKVKLKYSYRFLFVPGTIGAIAWLQINLDKVNRIKHGLVLTGLGDAGPVTYKKSRRGSAEIDKIVEYSLKNAGTDHHVIEFSPYGYDERQYGSPGFNLPVGRLSRTPYGEYPQYHTSADNLNFVDPKALGDSYIAVANILEMLEENSTYSNLSPHCEPQLGRRGLYDQIGPNQLAMLWVLNLSDGQTSLLDIAVRSGIDFQSIRKAADLLLKFELLK
jgi:aminopeptidase-like protein